MRAETSITHHLRRNRKEKKTPRNIGQQTQGKVHIEGGERGKEGGRKGGGEGGGKEGGGGGGEGGGRGVEGGGEGYVC